MKDLLSKVTFGFVMAQLAPGAVVVFSVLMMYHAVCATGPITLLSTHRLIFNGWSSSGTEIVIFLVLATAAGMLVHGIHWAVIGFLENRFESALRAFWYDLPIVVQVGVGPVKCVVEVALFLFLGRKVGDLAVDENVTRVPKDKMESFQFVQDFYLHFAQFYAHTAYAFIVAVVSVAVFMAAQGFSWCRLAAAFAFYLLSGLLFVLGRIQLASLFTAEEALGGKKGAPITPPGVGPAAV